MREKIIFVLLFSVILAVPMVSADVYQRKDIYGRNAGQAQDPAQNDTPVSQGFDPSEFMPTTPTKPAQPAQAVEVPAPVNPDPDPPPPEPTAVPMESAPQESKGLKTITPSDAKGSRSMPVSDKGGTPVIKEIKGAGQLIHSFRVLSSALSAERDENHFSHFRADVTFSRDVDPASLNFGTNFRVLVKNMAGNWLDAYPNDGALQVNGKQVTWISNDHYIEGTQKLHLRGTIRSLDGDFLDCDGDGQPEGGNLPAYESAVIHMAN